MENKNVRGKSNKKVRNLKIIMMALTVLTISAAAIYAYFIAEEKSSGLQIKTSKIGICYPDFNPYISNLLPGETSKVLNNGFEIITNLSQRELKIEVSFDQGVRGYLKEGSTPDPWYIGEDYYYDSQVELKDGSVKGLYVFTEKRLKEVVEAYMEDFYTVVDLTGETLEYDSDFTKNLTTNRYYAILKTIPSYVRLGDIHVRFTKDLGEHAKDYPATPTSPKKRDWEQSAVFQLEMRVAIVPTDYKSDNGKTTNDVFLDLFDKDYLEYEDVYFQVDSDKVLDPKSPINPNRK